MSVQTMQPVMPAQSPARVGQGTAIEQSRAVAEVHGAIVVAQQVPRDMDRAARDMLRSCGQKSLAEKAFFRYARGGSQISGASVQLARELARCFGNMQFGIVELRRDDQHGQSEMQAWAWDVQTNTRSSTTFIVQHIRDSRNGSTQLTEQRDIYENNANMGARRLREMIFAILPGWFTEDAVAACYRTLEGDERELPERIGTSIKLFGELGIRESQLVQKIGAPVDKWTPADLAQLAVIYRSLKRGETSRDEEFIPATLTAADITSAPVPGNGHASGHDTPPPTAEPDIPLPPDPDGGVSAAMATRMAEPSVRPLEVEDMPGSVKKDQVDALWKIGSTKLGFTKDDKATFRQACETITGRKLIGGTTGNLSSNEAEMLHAVLEPLADRSALLELLAKLARDRAQASEDEQ